MTFIRPRASVLALAIALATGSALFASPAVDAQAAKASKVDIAYQEFTLANGLRVIVHTDRKAPIVAVNIWYHVGSKDEPLGRSGFAHLFEHLMFQGSENHKGEFFEPFELVGATDQNGTTNSDRTNYFENVPTTALDTALFMESDRMGYLLGAMDQAGLDEQRGVVQNEKRQGENQPYGRVFDRILEKSYPEGHPYHHSTIGSMNDLNAASLEDVKNWFRSWYGPNNAVLVLAGDIDLKTAKEKATKYFGAIPASATVKKLPPMVAKRDVSTRETITDVVPQTRIYRTWNIPQTGDKSADQLQLLSQVLGGSRSSRLDKRLVFQDKLVDSVSASAFTSELGGIFFIQADVKQGVDAAKVEAAIDEELKKLLAEGPAATEVSQARTVFKAGFIRGIERIGGFGGKADTLAECAVFVGKPSCFRDSLATLDATTAADLKAVANTWLSKGDYTLLVVPGERKPVVEAPAVKVTSTAIPAADKKFKTVASNLDRSKGVPQTTSFPDLKFPAVQRGTLKNGLKVMLAERPGLPVVQFSMEFQGAGFASDHGHKAGTASFTMGMLDEGAGKYDALTLGDRTEALGANLGSGASLDGSNVFLSALKENLADSLALYSDVIAQPRFDDKEIERVRATWLATIKQEKANPASLIRRVFPALVYGKDHPYAVPSSGTGDEAGIASLTKADMQAWHQTWIRPENATLLIVGDTNLKEVMPKLEAAFANWQPSKMAKPSLDIPSVATQTKSRVFLINQPGAIQANIRVGHLVPSSKDANATEFEIANAILGGEFSSRLNMNLRENKHWSYGSYSGVGSAIAERPWFANAPVQIDKTTESAKELLREITDYATGKAPAKAEELEKIKASEIRGLPGSFETANAVMGALGGILRYERSDDYQAQRAAKISALTIDQVNAEASKINPNALTWVIVGDLTKIEAGIRGLNLGDVTVLDSDGNPVK